MNRSFTAVLLIAALMIVLPVCSGCGEKKGLKIGYIDTDQLLVKWEKYKKYGDDYLKEQQELMKKYSTGDQKPGFSDQVEMMKLREKWDKVKREIRDEIKTAANEVVKEKKLDLILDNTASDPVIEYGGVDITGDILKKLK